MYIVDSVCKFPASHLLESFLNAEYTFSIQLLAMKRAAENIPNLERDAKEQRLENDQCSHPLHLQSHAGSNCYVVRISCKACGALLQRIDRLDGAGRKIDPAVAPVGWEAEWPSMRLAQRLEVLRLPQAGHLGP